jgi:hypothetical protein
MAVSELDEFSLGFHQEILAKAGGGGDGDAEEKGGAALQHLREEIFTESVLELLDDHNEVDSWELCSYEGKSIGSVPAAKLNAWALSGDGATLDLFVTLYHGTGRTAEVGKPEARRHFELALGFLKRSLGGFHTRMEEASDAFNAARLIHAAKDALATVRLFLFSDGVIRSLDIEPEKIADLDIRYVAWDLEKLSQLKVGDRAEIELNIANDYGGGFPCLESPTRNEEFRTFLAFIPASTLARVYGQYGQRLLERNVRAFLQVKGKINKGLQLTLRDEPHRFLAYNNGLCCTAAEIKVQSDGDGKSSLTWVRDFQIVNGGQTTASIFHAIKKEKLDLENVTVQMKLTVIRDSERVAEIVPMISKYANSQNKVNGADFSANGKFHRDLEGLSRTVWVMSSAGMERGTHWYYERARGSYMDDKARQGTPARRKDWARENPLHQKFTKTDLAKYEHAWLGLPHLVCRGAEKNFEQFAARLEDDGEPAVDRSFFESVVARAILWRAGEDLFDSLELIGFRAQSVAYAVAWLAESSERRLDLGHIWKEQKLSASVAATLLALCSEAHKFIASRAGNPGESVKKPETWSEFRDTDIGVDDEWEKELLTTSATSYAKSKPKPEAEAAVNAISNIQAESWFALAMWAKERGFLLPWERSLAFSLGKIAAKGVRPSDKQAVQGARIFARARELGFSE